ncbi:MAG: hypothetical protein QG594_184 [Bacteroidota bacterium]|nr:hypothetical protein [Bacteroidota bacterium]
MTKIYILFCLSFFLCSGKLFSQEKNYLEAGLFNIGIGGLVGGVGAVINKKPDQKIGKQFIKGFGQGALGGYLLFESKLMIGQFAKTGNYGYVWPAKLMNSAGASIIENAAANANFLEHWHLNIGFARLDLNTEKSLNLKCRILPFALGGVIYGFANGKFAGIESLKTGSFVFTKTTFIENKDVLGRASVSSLIYYKNNGFSTDESVIGHELLHVFQYEESFGFNAYLDKPLRKLEKNSRWFKKYQSIFYTEYNYLLYIAVNSLENVYEKKIQEKEAFFYTE